MDSASVALMLLEGIGVEPDLDKGTEKLRLAVSIYAANKSTFDAAACFEQMMATISASDGVVLDLPVARTYLDWIVRFGVPGASRLLDRCGGPLPPREPRWELHLSSALPEKVAGHVWGTVGDFVFGAVMPSCEREALFEYDSELGLRLEPLARGPFPVLGGVIEDQV